MGRHHSNHKEKQFNCTLCIAEEAVDKIAKGKRKRKDYGRTPPQRTTATRRL